MNDLELIRNLFDRIPEADPARLAAGRERLAAAIARSTPAPYRRRRRPGSRQVWRLALIAAGALSIAAVGVLLKNIPSSPSRPLTARIALAAQVLRAAELTDASQPGNRPDPHQWIYSTAVGRYLGRPVQFGEQWTRFDGQQDAYLQDGELVVHASRVASNTVGDPLQRYAASATPMSAYEALASLPANSSALLGVVAVTLAGDPGSVAPPGSSPSSHHPTRGQLEFEFLATLLWNASQAAPAKAEANVFRAIATIPGVTAQKAVTDALGRSAIALSDVGDEQELLLDPRTYQVTGLRTISDGTWPINVMAAGHGRTYPSGTVLRSLTWETIRFVSRPGER